MTETGSDGPRGLALPPAALAGRSGTPTGIVPDWLSNLAALGWRVLAIAGLVVVAWLLCTSCGP